MQTGWVTWSKLGTKSYFNDDGKARTGWHTLWGKRYYFDPATARSLIIRMKNGRCSHECEHRPFH